MKKYFTIILSFIFMLVLILHGLIFTNTGNNIIAKYIEDEINYGQDRLLFKINNLKIIVFNFGKMESMCDLKMIDDDKYDELMSK